MTKKISKILKHLTFISDNIHFRLYPRARQLRREQRRERRCRQAEEPHLSGGLQARGPQRLDAVLNVRHMLEPGLSIG